MSEAWAVARTPYSSLRANCIPECSFNIGEEEQPFLVLSKARLAAIRLKLHSGARHLSRTIILSPAFLEFTTMFSAGDLVAVTTTSKPEFNTKVWRVIETRAEGRVVVHNDDDNQRIAVKEEQVTHLAVVPASTSAPPLAVPISLEDEIEVFTRFVFGNNSGGSRQPLCKFLNTWIPLPLLGGNMICLTQNTEPDYELLLFPQLSGYQLHFFSRWAQEQIRLQDCDVLKPCPACQVWPWCAYCHKFLFPVEAHRASKHHAKCLWWMERGSPEFQRVELMRRVDASCSHAAACFSPFGI